MGEESYHIISSNNDRSSSTNSTKCAFDWDIYKNRKSALQHLRRQHTLTDIILETEDGSASELVHSQVISAFGNKLTSFIATNGQLVDDKNIDTRLPQATSSANDDSSELQPLPVKGVYANTQAKLKMIRLPKVNKYTLNVLTECAYTGYVRTDLTSGGIWQVLEVADHYGMTEVIRACCSFLDKNLNRRNCVHFYHVGRRHEHPLANNAWHQIRANFKFILRENLLRSSRDLIENGILGPNWANSQSNGQMAMAQQIDEELLAKQNSLVTIRFDHFEAMLAHDKLNIDNEESVWFAIKLWCNHNLAERLRCVERLLTCMRFPRFRQGTDFSSRQIWRDPLIINNREAQHQLAILDRNHRELLSNKQAQFHRDGFNIPCAPEPKNLRPRVPHSVLLAIGGWQSGQPTRLIESYDLNCNLWFESKKKILMQLAYHGIENIDNLLYICGGTDGSEILNELFVFNPISGDCYQKPSMRESRCYVSTSNLSGFLYAMGGHNGVQRMRSVERYDLKNEIWLRCPDMNVARSDASACVYESMIFIAGGLNDQVIESSVEFYNHQDQSWTFIQSMLTPRTSFTLINYQAKLIAIGGNNGQERLNSVEMYDLNLRQWSLHSQMRHRRSTFSAALIDESKLIVVGGYNGQTPFASVEMLELESTSPTWQNVQRIRHDRSGLKVVVVKDIPNASDYTFHGSDQARGLLPSTGWASITGPSQREQRQAQQPQTQSQPRRHFDTSDNDPDTSVP